MSELFVSSLVELWDNIPRKLQTSLNNIGRLLGLLLMLLDRKLLLFLLLRFLNLFLFFLPLLFSIIATSTSPTIKLTISAFIAT